jgi:surfactin synthase thioesterase subunit
MDLALAVLDHRDDRPWALGGHSLGALIAFETAHTIRRLGGGEPDHLIVSGCSAPQEIRRDDPPISLLEDEALAKHLRMLGGTPEHILSHRAARHLLFAAFRPDAAVRDSWQYQQYSLLGSRVTAFAAEQDPRASVSSMSRWRAQTTDEAFDLHQIPGGHFAALETSTMCALLSRTLA